MNQIQHQSFEPHTYFDQQYFPVYGPPPVRISKLATLRQAIRSHWLGSVLLVGFGLFCLGSIWAANGYWGGETLYRWRGEILATFLSLLTLGLYRRFRQWGKERTARAARRIQYRQEMATLVRLTTLPSPSGEVRLTIDAWVSGASVPVSESHYQLAQLPDEFIAPDALVFNVQVPDER